MDSEIEVFSTIKIQHSSDLNKMVNSLNRTFKENNLMFGLTLNVEEQNKAVFTI